MGQADAHGKLGQLDVGLKLLTEAAAVIEASNERCIEVHLHLLKGNLLIATGDKIEAEQSYLQALAVARQQGAKPWELRAATNLACLWRDQGKRDEARDLLAAVYGWFSEGFDTPVLKETKALLDELASA
jgi:predicted ATPase